MKTKLLFYTDPHVTHVTPRHRVDDFSLAILGKIREVYEIASAENCDFVVLGGDLFNSYRIFSYELISDLMDIMCFSSLDTYAVVGQHDILGYNPDSFKSSTLSFVTRHCPKLKILWEPVEVNGVVLHPSHVWDKVEESLTPKSLDPAKVNILVAHHLIHNKKKMFETVPTTLFKDGPYDLVLSGDLHCGFEPHEHNGRWFCNPGSLARRASDEIDRVPQVAIIELKKGSIPFIELRSLKASRPGSEVFGQDVIDVIKKGQEEFDPTSFVKNIEEFESQSVDIHELVQKAGLAKGVKAEVLEYLGSKKT